MLTKPQMEKYSDVLLWGLETAKKRPLRKNEIVLVRLDLPAIKMAEILHAKLLDLGLNPIIRPGGTAMMERHFFEKARDKQLVFLGPGEKELCEGIHGNIYLHAPESITHLSHVDPKKIGKATVARKPLRDILQRREEEGDYSWTLCTLPTQELAKQAKLSIGQYTNQILRACYLDKPEPVKIWRGIHRDAMGIKQWLNQMDVKFYHMESENIDLKITPGKNRKWIGISGHNIPSFEIFLSPDWRGTEGIYYSNLASFRSGNYVEGVRLVFERGSAVQIEAKKGEDFLRNQLSMDKGACRVGEFSLTDKRFSRIDRFMANTLYDENYGGAFGNSHLAVGSSYSDSYSGNVRELTREMKRKLGFNDSALHWDLVNTEKKVVTAHLTQGKKVVIYENGKFTF